MIALSLLLAGAAAAAPVSARSAPRTVVFGAHAVRAGAPGAPALISALSRDRAVPVLGIIRRDRQEVVNAFAQGEHGVLGHEDALPPGLDRRVAVGYTLFVRRDGAPSFGTSGAFPGALSAGDERAIAAYVGLRPLNESPWGRARRVALSGWDSLLRWQTRPAPTPLP